MSKILIAYFSYTGNTGKIVEQIQKKMKFDMFRIETEIAYSNDFNQVVDQGQKEVNRDFRPALKTKVNNMDEYDTIILCSPIWWYTMVPAIKSFLASYDFAGKTIAPLITNGGYGLGKSMSDLKKLCPDSKILSVLELSFDEDRLQTPIEELDNWLSKLK